MGTGSEEPGEPFRATLAHFAVREPEVRHLLNTDRAFRRLCKDYEAALGACHALEKEMPRSAWQFRCIAIELEAEIGDFLSGTEDD